MPEEKKEKSDSQQEPQKAKKSNSKLWCGCCLGLFILFLLMIVFYLRFNGLFSGADTMPVITPDYLTPVAGPRQTNTSFAEPQSCQKLTDYSSSPMEISTDNPGYHNDIKTHYYNIYGASGSDLTKQMSDCGPEGFAGRTSYNISWKFGLEKITAGCALKNIAVGMQIDFYYPSWQKPKQFASGLENWWNQYMTGLEKHENTHRDMDLAGGQNLYNGLMSLPAQSDCATMNQVANDEGNRLYHEIQAENDKFDADTDHGRNP